MADKGFFQRLKDRLKGTGTAAAGAGRAGASGLARGVSAVGVGAAAGVSRASRINLPNIMLYVFLIVLGVLDIIVKRLVGYDPRVSLLISIVLGFIFFLVVRGSKSQIILVGAAFAIDVFATQLPLWVLPDLGIREFLIGIKVFAWLLLGIILFVMEFIETARAGQELPVTAYGVIIVIFALVLFFTYPQLVAVYQTQAQTHADYFGIAEEQIGRVEEIVKDRVATWKEVYFRFTCALGSPTEIEECTNKKIAEARCKPYQEAGDAEGYDACVKAELGLKIPVEGIVDPVLEEPLEIRWVRGDEFSQRDYFAAGIPTFSAQLQIENPRNEELDLRLECGFSELAGSENITGSVFSTQGESFQITGPDREIEVICSPNELLENNKKYKVYFQAELIDFTTQSNLQMLFIGEGKDDNFKRQLSSDYPLAGKSRSPRDLARLNLDFGEEAYIENEEVIRMGASIENLGGGQITSVQKSEIDLTPPGIGATDLMRTQPCSLEGNDEILTINPTVILLQQSQKDILGGVCFLKLSNDLKYPEEFVKVAEFQGTLTYSYRVREQFITPTINLVGGAP